MSGHVISPEPIQGSFRGVELIGKTVHVGDDDEFLESRLKAGRLLIQTKRRAWPAITYSTFEDCEIVFPSKATSNRVNLLGTRFVRCAFRGTLAGVDFGANPLEGERDSFGAVESCDFSEAILQGCRFLNTDVRSQRFPGHPHLVLFSPSTRRADVEELVWPGQLLEYMRVCTDKPDYFSASVLYLPHVCKLTKCSEPDAIAAFRAFGGVLEIEE